MCLFWRCLSYEIHYLFSRFAYRFNGITYKNIRNKSMFGLYVLVCAICSLRIWNMLTVVCKGCTEVLQTTYIVDAVSSTWTECPRRQHIRLLCTVNTPVVYDQEDVATCGSVRPPATCLLSAENVQYCTQRQPLSRLLQTCVRHYLQFTSLSNPRKC